MTEVTRVPLQPVEKGSLLKFFLGVLVGAALASAAAWYIARPASVDVETITAGTGDNPKEDSAVFVDYVGKLEGGTVFDQSPPRGDIPEQIPHLNPPGPYLGHRDGPAGPTPRGRRDPRLQASGWANEWHPSSWHRAERSMR